VPKVLGGNALRAEIAGTRVGLIGRDRFAELIAAVLRIEGCVVEREGRFDIAVETTGSATEIAALCEALRPGGMLIVKSRTPEPVALPLAVIVDKQLVVRGARYGSFARAVELVSSDELQLDALFGDSFSLADWETAFARARAGEATKLFFRMDDDPCAA
jgi:threonine dehydrogenase-like Zn-dependent dehydrogenase